MAVHFLPERGLDDESLSPGQQVGRYRIVRRLAMGGMAELYLAHATGLEGFEKIVAIKRVQPVFAIDPDFVTMFLDEARVASTLSHPNIAQVYDVGVDGHSYFIAMEFVDGRDARHLLRESIRRGERMPIAIAVGIAGAVAAGLHAAHENLAPDRTPLRIVHRDVSPGNVLVTFGGAVKLIDFGIAKAARRRTITQAGQLKGKAGYMSPEQCTGGTVDRRSDIYSLGIVLYELTTTTRLFRGRDEYAIMQRIVNGDIAPPALVVPGYPAELERIVMRALQRDPEKRYQTARELHIDLMQFARSRDLDVTEYDLAKYVQELIPDEKKSSILTIALPQEGEEEPQAAALRMPTVAPLAIARARHASTAETMIATQEEAQRTSIYMSDTPANDEEARDIVVAPTRVAAPPPAPVGVWRALAVVLLAATLFASGWLAAGLVCG